MALGLVKNGVPWTIAMEDLDEAELLAFTIIMAEHEGGEFDWSNKKWKDRN